MKVFAMSGARDSRIAVACALFVIQSAIGRLAIAETAKHAKPPAPCGALPTRQQLAWHEREFYAFVHFNMNTFTGIEWGTGTESPARFHPRELDCRQWCALFKECGLTGVILTAKHHDGFCLWPSRFTDHDVASSRWRDGKGDVVKELAEACQEYGLWLGIYISPWDRNNPLYGNDDAAYNDYFVGQMEELLSNYGPIAEVWWDGANGDRNKPEKHQDYDWPRFIATVRRLQPEAVIFAPPYSPGDVRWVGNEEGRAAETQWSTHPSGVAEDPSTLNVGIEGADSWMPAETDVSIRSDWYWSPATEARVRSDRQLLDIYYASVGRNTNLLLNFPVDDRGLVPEPDAQQLRQLSTRIREIFANNLAKGRRASATNVRGSSDRFAAANLTDDDPSTYWATDDDVSEASVEVALQTATPVDHVVFQEHIELGQRVRSWSLAVNVGGEWQEVDRGTTIGNKRIVHFPAVKTNALRLTIFDSRACPAIESLSVYASPTAAGTDEHSN
jgi:alpha-L-fucosidase